MEIIETFNIEVERKTSITEVYEQLKEFILENIEKDIRKGYKFDSIKPIKIYISVEEY